MSAQDYLQLKYHETHATDYEQFRKYNSTNPLPFGNSPLFHAPVKNAKLLTKGEDVKTVIQMSLDLEEINYSFNPGETIGIIPSNDDVEVELLISLLNLENVTDRIYSLSILKETSKKNPSIPKHIPETGTIKYVLTHCLDIRGPPSKLFLRSLLPYTHSEEDKEKLSFICSPKGSPEYNKLITGKGKTVLGLLKTFSSCKPPIERLLEHLPSIKPRPYSISSSPLNYDKELHITFSVVEHDDGTKGLCTGYLQKLTTKAMSEKDLCDIRICMYFRKASNFCFPSNPVPIIMLGPGTGVSPFIGFLEHRNLKREVCKFGDWWLFFGCRYSDRDFLYKDNLDHHLREGNLSKLFTAFSRQSPEKVYVQHKIREYGKQFVDTLYEQNAVVYVCGDAKNMASDVRETIIEVLMQFVFSDRSAAENYICLLEKNGRYIQELWR